MVDAGLPRRDSLRAVGLGMAGVSLILDERTGLRGGRKQTSQRRLHHGRRPGLWGVGGLRPGEDPYTVSRPDRPGGAATHTRVAEWPGSSLSSWRPGASGPESTSRLRGGASRPDGDPLDTLQDPVHLFNRRIDADSRPHHPVRAESQSIHHCGCVEVSVGEERPDIIGQPR